MLLEGCIEMGYSGTFPPTTSSGGNWDILWLGQPQNQRSNRHTLLPNLKGCFPLVFFLGVRGIIFSISVGANVRYIRFDRSIG